MKLINDSTHGILDYVAGISIILSPSLFGFEWGSAGGYATFICGSFVLFYSLLTDYNPGMIRFISMPTHLITDRVTGVFLGASPWIFDFSTSVFIPHLLMGAILISLSVLSTDMQQATTKPAVYLKQRVKPHVRPSYKRMMINRYHIRV